jgi:hypothetical protein
VLGHGARSPRHVPLGQPAQRAGQFDVAKSVGQTGTYNFAGGTIANGYLLKLGSEGGTGTFRHGANLTASWTDGNNGGIWIGGTNGSGTYYLGDTNGTGVVTVLMKSGLRIGPTGVLRGRGSFGSSPWNAMQVSGKVIADGYGTNSDLDMSVLGDHYSSVAALTNPVENASDKGWFAIRGGKLKFPAVGTSSDTNTYVKSANGSIYNVGESVYAADSVIDLHQMGEAVKDDDDPHNRPNDSALLSCVSRVS